MRPRCRLILTWFLSRSYVGRGSVTISFVAILDAHTHLSGSEFGETPDNIIQTLDVCGVDKAFVFAPLLDVRSWKLINDDLSDIRSHNDYCAGIASADPQRLFGFCVVDPSPGLAGGSSARAVDLMIEEVSRCYHDLGLRGVKMVPRDS